MKTLLSTIAFLLALAPAQSFAIGCIGEWPDQICVEGSTWKPVVKPPVAKPHKPGQNK